MVVLVVLAQAWANYKTSQKTKFLILGASDFGTQCEPPVKSLPLLVRLNVWLKGDFNHSLTKRAQNGLI